MNIKQKAEAILAQPENCEDDNLVDMFNLCCDADAQLKATENLRRGESVVNTRLLGELERYRQAPNIPHIKGGTCHTTHSACDCMIKQLSIAKDLIHHAADENEQLKITVEAYRKCNICMSKQIDKLTDEPLSCNGTEDGTCDQDWRDKGEIAELLSHIADLQAELADCECRKKEIKAQSFRDLLKPLPTASKPGTNPEPSGEGVGDGI